MQFVEDAPDLPVAVVPADHGDESSLAAKAQSQSDQTAPANCGASAHPFAIWLSQKSLIPIDVKDSCYWMEGAADVAETKYTPFQSEPDAVPVRLIVRRVKPTSGSQLALFATYSYHAFIIDRDGDTLYLEADHRRHAEIENTIRDLKYGVGLNHLPSGRFPANAAWLAVQAYEDGQLCKRRTVFLRQKQIADQQRRHLRE